jgi:hypothetical protein
MTKSSRVQVGLNEEFLVEGVEVPADVAALLIAFEILSEVPSLLGLRMTLVRSLLRQAA